MLTETAICSPPDTGSRNYFNNNGSTEEPFATLSGVAVERALQTGRNPEMSSSSQIRAPAY